MTTKSSDKKPQGKAGGDTSIGVIQNFLAKNKDAGESGEKAPTGGARGTAADAASFYGQEKRGAASDVDDGQPKAVVPPPSVPVDTRSTAAVAEVTDDTKTSPLIADDTGADPSTPKNRLAELKKPKKLFLAVIGVVLFVLYAINMFSDPIDAPAKTPQGTLPRQANDPVKSPSSSKDASIGWQDLDGAAELPKIDTQSPANQSPAPISSSTATPDGTAKADPTMAPGGTPSIGTSNTTPVQTAPAVDTPRPLDLSSTASANVLAAQVKKEVQDAIGELTRTSEQRHGELTALVTTLGTKVADLQKELQSVTRARDQAVKSAAQANAKPDIVVHAILRTSNCDVCVPFALVAYGKKTVHVGTGDSIAGFKATVKDDRLIVSRGNVQHSFFPSAK